MEEPSIILKMYKQSGIEDLAYKRETGVWENIFCVLHRNSTVSNPAVFPKIVRSTENRRTS